MAFVWSSLNKGDVPRKSDIDEIVDKINQILSELDKGLFWPYKEFAQRGGMYDYDRIVALRQVIDQLDAIKCNDCSSFNAFEKTAACPMAKAGYCSTDYQNNLSVNNTTEDTGYNQTYKNNELAGNNVGVDSTVYSGEDVVVNSLYDGMDKSAEYYTADTGYDDTVYSAAGSCVSDDTGAYVGHNLTDDDTECGSYCSGVFATFNGTYYGGEKVGDNSGVDSGYNAAYYVEDDSGYDSGVKSGDYVTNLEINFGDEKAVAGACSGDDSGYDSAYNSGYDGTYYSSEDNPYDASVYDAYNLGFDGTYYSSEDSPYDSSVYGVYKSGYDTTYNSGEDSPYDSSVYDAYNGGFDGAYDGGVDGLYNGSVNTSN